jgi:biotin carboxyl carrier protein
VKFEIYLSASGGPVKRTVEVEPSGGGWRVCLDGEPTDADVRLVAPHTLSILLRGQSFEVRVTEQPNGALKLLTRGEEFTAEVVDPRAWRGRRHGPIEAGGRQKIQAPMPGKVIRVLVNEGQNVEAGQGLMVVEAMKMQNEVRSPKSGVVQRVFAKEGQAVDVGEVLAWVE